MRQLRPSDVRLKLFVTCWLVFVLHFATDIVREHYLAFSLAEDQSFSVEKYLGLHVDIFAVPGRGAFISNNPGASMAAAVPLWLVRPLIDRVCASVASRQSGQAVSAVYNDPRPRRVEFYRKVRERGLDVRFGLAAAAIQALFMAPLSALAAVVMFGVIQGLGVSRGRALLYAFVFALGTPVFFRTAFLNQNLFVAHLLLFGFVALWRTPLDYGSPNARAAAAGAAAGLAILSDYSGIVVAAWLALYATWRAWDEGGAANSLRRLLWFSAGAAGPVLLLLFYQWRAFGSPWFPAQRYMPAVPNIDVGYRGFGMPQWELCRMLLVDPRFGLFVSAPILALGIVGFAWAMVRATVIPRREAIVLFGFAVSLLMFFSGVQFTRLEWVTGTRYMSPAIVALLLLAVPVLERMPAPLRFVVMVCAFTEAWCLAMVRAIYVHDSLIQVFFGGFQLPWMNVLVKMAPQYFPFMAERASPVALLLLWGVLIAGVWRWRPQPIVQPSQIAHAESTV
jgi:hypothetical protein